MAFGFNVNLFGKFGGALAETGGGFFTPRDPDTGKCLGPVALSNLYGDDAAYRPVTSVARVPEFANVVAAIQSSETLRTAYDNGVLDFGTGADPIERGAGAGAEVAVMDRPVEQETAVSARM